jgi:hypothetical protein
MLCTDAIARTACQQLSVIHVTHAAPHSLHYDTGTGTLHVVGDFSNASSCPSAEDMHRVLGMFRMRCIALLFTLLVNALRVEYLRQKAKVYETQLPTREKEILDALGVKVPIELVLGMFVLTYEIISFSSYVVSVFLCSSSD